MREIELNPLCNGIDVGKENMEWNFPNDVETKGLTIFMHG